MNHGIELHGLQAIETFQCSPRLLYKMAASLEKAVKLRDKTNWSIWKFATQIVLESKGWLSYVDGTNLEPGEFKADGSKKSDQAYRDELRAFKKIDIQVREIIVLRLEESVMGHILTCTTAYDMWSKLSAVFEQKSEVSIDVLQARYYNHRLQGQGVAKYFSELEEIREQLSQLNEKISDRMFMSRVMTGLPEDFRYFQSAWDSTESNRKTVNELVSRLLIEEERMKGKQKETEEVAFVSKHYRNGKPNRQERKGTKSKSGCNFCHRTDHVADDCKLKDDYDNETCFKCHKKGHKSRDCKVKAKSEKNKKSDSKEEPKVAYATVALMGGSQIEKNKWYADSAATEYMCCNKDWIDDYKPLKGKIKVKVGDGNIVEAMGVGTINIKTFTGQKWIEGILTDVLYVPELPCNLFSTTTAATKGFTFKGNEKVFTLMKDSEPVLVGYMKGKLYELEMTVVKENTQKSAKSSALLSERINPRETLTKWHRRLAHQNVIQVRAILKKFDIDFVDEEDFFCESCMLGKMHCLPFQESENRASNVGEVIHADVCGTMEEPSLSGSRYYLLLKDDFSHFRGVYFLKQKSEVTSCVIRFLELTETQTGSKVKCLRTDNGTEFVNKELESYLNGKGIVHQKSCPYTSQQAGCVERENRTVVEAARTMLQEAELPKKFWAEATAYAVFVLNRSGTSSQKDKTPYELWSEKKPKIRKFRVFGSTVFTKVPDQLRQKWDPKAKRGVFVGMQENVKGYRIYLPEENKIIVSRNVIVNERKYKCSLKEGHDSSGNVQVEWVSKDQDLEEQDFEDLDSSGDENFLVFEPEDLENTVVEIESLSSDDEPSENEESSLSSKDKPSEVLKQKREVRIPEKFKDFEMSFVCANEAVLFYASNIDSEDLTFEEATSGPDSEDWMKAVKNEFQALEENETWSVCDRPKENTSLTQSGCSRLRMERMIQRNSKLD